MIFPAIWRVLPGGTFVKSVLLLTLLVLVSAALFEWVFPWASATLFPYQDQVVESLTLLQPSLS